MLEFFDGGFEEFEAAVGGAGFSGGAEVVGDVAEFGEDVDDGTGWVADPGEVVTEVEQFAEFFAVANLLGGDADNGTINFSLAAGVAAEIFDFLAGCGGILCVSFDQETIEKRQR